MAPWIPARTVTRAIIRLTMMNQPIEVEIHLNGDPSTVPAGTTILALLETRGRHPRTVAIEYNGDILGREAYGETELHTGDRVEIVHFVQGGSPRLR